MENQRILNWKELVGGPGGVRTLDLMTASHARSQLRHRPKLLKNQDAAIPRVRLSAPSSAFVKVCEPKTENVTFCPAESL